MFKFCISFVKYYAEKGEIKGEEEKKRMTISDSHYYRIWHYSVLVSISSAISASFVIKINPRLGWKITSASLLHGPVADMEMVACFQLFQIRKIRHMFI